MNIDIEGVQGSSTRFRENVKKLTVQEIIVNTQVFQTREIPKFVDIQIYDSIIFWVFFNTGEMEGLERATMSSQTVHKVVWVGQQLLGTS